jgi:serine/threonine protein phosphatase PrpC
VNDHFSPEHHKLILLKNIEFMCKKGKGTTENQDNFFILIDGEVKIFGLFDGHGVNGNQVSGFASGMMLNFIRNIASDFFAKKNLSKASDAEIERMIKRCFKYV